MVKWLAISACVVAFLWWYFSTPKRIGVNANAPKSTQSKPALPPNVTPIKRCKHGCDH